MKQITNRINVYGSEKELATIKAHADAAGLSVSTYLLKCGLQKVRPVLNQTEIAPALHELICEANSCKMQGCSTDSCPVLSRTIDLVRNKLYGKRGW